LKVKAANPTSGTPWYAYDLIIIFSIGLKSSHSMSGSWRIAFTNTASFDRRKHLIHLEKRGSIKSVGHPTFFIHVQSE